MGHIKQSITWWSFALGDMTIERLVRIAADIGYEAIELVEQEYWPLIKDHGLVIASLRGQSSIEEERAYDKGKHRCKEKTTMNIDKLDHVSFLVKDVERSRRFYSQVLGLRELARPSNASPLGAWLTNDKHSFEVHLIGEAEAGRVAQTHARYRRDEMARGYGTHAAFEVDDLEEAQRHLKSHNVTIVGGPRPRGDGVMQLYVCDPDGYMVELYVWPK